MLVNAATLNITKKSEHEMLGPKNWGESNRLEENKFSPRKRQKNIAEYANQCFSNCAEKEEQFYFAVEKTMVLEIK